MLGLSAGVTVMLGVFLFVLVVGTFMWLSATSSPVCMADSKADADRVQQEQGVSGARVRAEEQEFVDSNPL